MIARKPCLFLAIALGACDGAASDHEPEGADSAPISDSTPADDSAPADDSGADDSAADDSGADDSGADDSGAPAGPPNVLLVIADDLGLDKASFDPSAPCYSVGEPDEDPLMPNLAAICQRGVRFDQAWAMPTCSPFRATVLTGTFPHAHGLGAPLGGGEEIDTSLPTLPSLLAAAGSDYATANFGKWHISTGAADPNVMGWQRYAGALQGDLPGYWDWERTLDGVSEHSSAYATTQNVDDAISWLGERPDGQPWLLWLAFNAPHTPLHRPPDGLHSDPALPELSQPVSADDRRRYFAAMAEALDAELGRLLAELEARGELENTLIIFIGDNGTPGNVADPPFDATHAKGTLSQGGVLVPLIIAGPGVAGGRAVPHLVSAIDLFDTILEAAGEDPDALQPDNESVSLWPVLRGEAGGELREHVLVEQFGGVAAMQEVAGRAIRGPRYKLICYERGERPALFDLVDDPYEQVDLLDGEPSEEAIAQAAALRARMAEWVGQDVCPG